MPEHQPMLSSRENEQTVSTSDRQPPFGNKRRHRLLWPVIRIVAIGYMTYLVGLYFYQDGMLFPTDVAGEPAGDPFYADVEVYQRPLENGGSAVAWYFPANTTNNQAPLAVFFHGNAELIDHMKYYVDIYRSMGFAVLLPEYRGYGRSDGEPSQAAIVEDVVYFHDEIVKKKNIAPQQKVYHGVSLGGGVAAQLAERRPPAALILQSTFASIGEMAWRYGAPPCLARHPFYTNRILDDFGSPVLIFHGREDQIIPVGHGRRLHEAAPNSRYVEYNCGHNNFPGKGNGIKYQQTIREFLADSNMISPSTTMPNEKKRD
jgi:hypothetical protein